MRTEETRLKEGPRISGGRHESRAIQRAVTQRTRELASAHKRLGWIELEIYFNSCKRWVLCSVLRGKTASAGREACSPPPWETRAGELRRGPAIGCGQHMR